MLAGERAEKAALIATLTDIVPRLDQLTKRVEDIARTPLPPLAMAGSVTAVSKQQDCRRWRRRALVRRSCRRLFPNEQGRADLDPDQGQLRQSDPPAAASAPRRNCAANDSGPPAVTEPACSAGFSLPPYSGGIVDEFDHSGIAGAVEAGSGGAGRCARQVDLDRDRPRRL